MEKIQIRRNGMNNMSIMVSMDALAALGWYCRAKGIFGVSTVLRDILAPLCDEYLLMFAHSSLEHIARLEDRDVTGLVSKAVAANCKLKLKDLLKLSPSQVDQYLVWAEGNLKYCSPVVIALLDSIKHNVKLPLMAPPEMVEIVVRNRK